MTQDIPIMKTASEFPAELGRISAIPRTRLFAGPTPLEAMPNLARSCGGGTFVVKRDDCMGLAFGGNKVRQLEFYIGEAQAQNADTVLITGAVQSNFVRLAAAAARKSGMDCHVQLEERVTKSDAAYRNSGNVLIDRLLGATLHSYPDGEDEAGADKRLGEIADGLRQSGRRPYVIPLAPGHPPLGALGYVVAAHELARQIADTGLEIDEIVVASGSGNTHAGLLFGLRALGSGIPVTGICVRRDAGAQHPRIAARCREIADLLEIESKVGDGDISVNDTFLPPGYGAAGEETLRAILLAARTEALILDPTYTGKAMAGFIHQAKAAEGTGARLFIHTGGTPAIFAYENELTGAAVQKL
jgi:D-cysteine desulfhydrase/L-cysteate sulfo-lyase